MPKDDCLKLRRCPFCGGRGVVDSMADGCKGMFTVYCELCGVSNAIYDTEQEAIEAWNTRVVAE